MIQFSAQSAASYYAGGRQTQKPRTGTVSYCSVRDQLPGKLIGGTEEEFEERLHPSGASARFTDYQQAYEHAAGLTASRRPVDIVEVGRDGDDPVYQWAVRTEVQDIEGAQASLQLSELGILTYNHFYEKDATWHMLLTPEQLEKADALLEYGISGYENCVHDQSFWISYFDSGLSPEEYLNTIAATGDKDKCQELIDRTPAKVREAWMKAAEKAGTDGLGFTQDGQISYLSEFRKQYMEYLMSAGARSFLGDSVESVLEFAEKALERLKQPQDFTYNSRVQLQRMQERKFYEELISLLK